MLGDTRSCPSPPQADDPHSHEQADAGQPTNQKGRHRSVEMSHGDRGGDPKAQHRSHERTGAILRREPLQFGARTNGNHDPEESAEDRSGEEPSLPCPVAKNGTDHGAHPCRSPGGQE